MDNSGMNECFKSLAEEARGLYLDVEVPVLDEPPSPLQFCRDYVTPNKPVIIRGVTDSWPALAKWTNQYLREKFGDQSVTVAVTPNGYADAVNEDRFVMPEERSMAFSQFLDIIEKKMPANGVFYVQKQNSNFTDEFRDLMEDAERDISWATEAFGCEPDAVNFWIGDERAVTSLHKDHYENLYCVVRGQKTFILIPPTDQPFVPYRDYQAAVYKENCQGSFDIINDMETGTVPWIPVDPLNPDLVTYPEFGEARPMTVTVSAGETLYLPSLWLHHVQQSHGCIAVNYWYDMQFDIKYNYFQFVSKLREKLNKKAS